MGLKSCVIQITQFSGLTFYNALASRERTEDSLRFVFAVGEYAAPNRVASSAWSDSPILSNYNNVGDSFDPGRRGDIANCIWPVAVAAAAPSPSLSCDAWWMGRRLMGLNWT